MLCSLALHIVKKSPSLFLKQEKRGIGIGMKNEEDANPVCHRSRSGFDGQECTSLDEDFFMFLAFREGKNEAKNQSPIPHPGR